MGSERNFEQRQQAREALGHMEDYLSFRVRQDKRLKLQTLLENKASEVPEDMWAKLRFEQGLVEAYEVNYREAIAIWDILGPMQFDQADADGLTERRLHKTLSAYETAIAFYLQAFEQKDLEQEDLTLGVALGLLNQYAEAIAAFDRAIEASPNPSSAWYNKAVALRKLGQTSEAIAAFDAALDIAPNSLKVHYGRAMLLCDLNRHGKAAADWDCVLSAQPARLDTLYARGLSLTYLGQSREAIAAIGAVLNLAPAHQEMLQFQGHAFYKLRRYRDAVEAYAVALEFQQAYRSVGNSQTSYGQFVCQQLSQLKALLSPETPLAAEPASEDSERNPFEMGNFGSAEAPELPLLVEPVELETAVNEAVDENVAEPVALEATTGERVTEPMESEDGAIAEAPSLSSASEPVLPPKMEQTEEPGQEGEPEPELQTLGEPDELQTQATTEDYEALYNQGNALVRQGRYEAAIATYDVVLTIQPGYRSAVYNKACCYALWGKVEHALQQLEAAIALHPEYGEKARTDEDLLSLREDDSFMALTNQEDFPR